MSAREGRSQLRGAITGNMGSRSPNSINTPVSRGGVSGVHTALRGGGMRAVLGDSQPFLSGRGVIIQVL